MGPFRKPVHDEHEEREEDEVFNIRSEPWSFEGRSGILINPHIFTFVSFAV